MKILILFIKNYMDKFMSNYKTIFLLLQLQLLALSAPIVQGNKFPQVCNFFSGSMLEVYIELLKLKHIFNSQLKTIGKSGVINLILPMKK